MYMLYNSLLLKVRLKSNGQIKRITSTIETVLFSYRATNNIIMYIEILII